MQALFGKLLRRLENALLDKVGLDIGAHLGANADACVVRTRTRFNQEKQALRSSRCQSIRSRDRNEAEAFMVFSFVVPLAAFEAGNAAFHRMNASECGAALAASVKIFSLEADAFQREIVAA